MNTAQNPENQNTSSSEDRNTDVTRSQRREGANPGNTNETPVGTASEDTGSRPANADKDNQQRNTNMDATGSHREGQYPRNHVDPAEGRVGKPGDKPE